MGGILWWWQFGKNQSLPCLAWEKCAFPLVFHTTI
jgi:hypothetical protein